MHIHLAFISACTYIHAQTCSVHTRAYSRNDVYTHRHSQTCTDHKHTRALATHTCTHTHPLTAGALLTMHM